MKLGNLIKYSKSINLLYVEDNKEARESILLMLNELFDNIIVATDGKDGLNKFKFNKNKIDLIITDINMPQLNGLEMIDKIRDINKKVPIIIFSSYEDKDNNINSVKLNISSYINKPIDIQKFEPVITKVVKKIIIQKIHEEFE